MPSGVQVASFGYHDVTDDPASSGFQRPGAAPYRLTPQRFTEHLAQIATSPLIPERVTDIDLSGCGQHLLLTFDDGGKSAVYVSEELSRRGWKGHFFIVTSLIGARTFVAARDIRYIRSQGHVIGSHSHTHPNIFKEQPFVRMAEEWRVSCDRLAQLLGEPCTTAGVPGGDISSAVLQSAGAAGLDYLFTSEPWLLPRRVNGCWILGRFAPKVGTSPARLHELVHFQGWRRALLVRRVKVLARLVAPLPYRLLVRRRTRDFAASS